jgi:hypothetical protein
MMRQRATLAASSLTLALALAACGGSSPSTPNPQPSATAVPTPTPTPTPSQPEACRLNAPKVDCSTRRVKAQELAEPLQAAVDAAMRTGGVMYSDVANRVYDLERFRSLVVQALAAQGICGAWDYGNVTGDEIYVRSEDGCVIEQYDLITGDGGIRNANKASNPWQEGWGVPVPGPEPQWPKEGDLGCSLPSERSTFCFSIKLTPGEFGRDLYQLFTEVLSENPQLFDRSDFVPGQGETNPDQLRLAAWRILNGEAYVAAVEKKLRGRGYCAFVERGDILKVKSIAKGNIFHEELDIVQNPAGGGSYVGFVIRDRCHQAGF